MNNKLKEKYHLGQENVRIFHTSVEQSPQSLREESNPPANSQLDYFISAITSSKGS